MKAKIYIFCLTLFTTTRTYFSKVSAIRNNSKSGELLNLYILYILIADEIIDILHSDSIYHHLLESNVPHTTFLVQRRGKTGR